MHVTAHDVLTMKPIENEQLTFAGLTKWQKGAAIDCHQLRT